MKKILFNYPMGADNEPLAPWWRDYDDDFDYEKDEYEESDNSYEEDGW